MLKKALLLFIFLFTIILTNASDEYSLSEETNDQESYLKEIEDELNKGMAIHTNCNHDYLPHEVDITKFYRCSNGFTTLMTCPNGTIYKYKGKCDHNGPKTLIKAFKESCDPDVDGVDCLLNLSVSHGHSSSSSSSESDGDNCGGRCVYGICVRYKNHNRCHCYHGFFGPRCQYRKRHSTTTRTTTIPPNTTNTTTSTTTSSTSPTTATITTRRTRRTRHTHHTFPTHFTRTTRNFTTTIRPHPCDPNPCQNGGTCQVKANIAVCICAVGWGGEFCAIILLSLKQNVSAEVLLRAGYRDIYDFPYSHDTTTSEINIIHSVCRPFSLVCVAGVRITTPNILAVVSCGLCSQIFSSTTLNHPHLVNGAYWYLTAHFSFGFSDIYHINQNTCDITNLSDKLKLCWHLDYVFGGWRLGSIYGIFNAQFYKRIYLRL